MVIRTADTRSDLRRISATGLAKKPRPRPSTEPSSDRSGVFGKSGLSQGGSSSTYYNWAIACLAGAGHGCSTSLLLPASGCSYLGIINMHFEVGPTRRRGRAARRREGAGTRRVLRRNAVSRSYSCGGIARYSTVACAAFHGTFRAYHLV